MWKLTLDVSKLSQTLSNIVSAQIEKSMPGFSKKKEIQTQLPCPCFISRRILKNAIHAPAIEKQLQKWKMTKSFSGIQRKLASPEY